MNADPVDGRAKLIHQRGTKQIRIADGPGLIRIIQCALRGGEKVVWSKVIGRRPEVVSPEITPEKRVLRADLVIASAEY